MTRKKYEVVKVLSVDMDEMTFSSKSKTLIITEGITSCIAFVVRGKFWYDDLLKPFCGIFHWSGFPTAIINPLKETTDTLSNFFLAIREDLGVDQDSIIEISQLAFVGGEHCQYEHSSGEILLSGTESEVKNLIQAVQCYNYKNALISIDMEKIEHHHFLTSGEESLLVKVDLRQWEYNHQYPASKTGVVHSNYNMATT